VYGIDSWLHSQGIEIAEKKIVLGEFVTKKVEKENFPATSTRCPGRGRRSRKPENWLGSLVKPWLHWLHFSE
jgi:hypothetical protein